MHFEPWQWPLLVLGATLAGFSKTGVPGIGGLFVVIFANLLPAREAIGVALPLLIVADVFGVLYYRQHASWIHLRRIFPWTAAGVVLGWLALGRLNDQQAGRLIGGIIGMLLLLQIWFGREKPSRPDAVAPASLWPAGLLGILAGFATLVANAAGPVMSLYFLAMRLPKLAFMGTGAVFFLVLNWFKAPFLIELGLINRHSLIVDLYLAPFALLGALGGPAVLKHINQKTFERLTLVLTGLAVLKILLD